MIHKTQSQYFSDRAKLEALNVGEQIEYYLCDYEYWASIIEITKRFCDYRYSVNYFHIKRIV